MAKNDTKNGSHWELPRCSSRMFRLREHIERFVLGSDASEADGLHLFYLLQLELRDVFRHGAEAETEVAQLRERLERMESSKMEKEAVDRQSLAGMALAHADACAELCSQVRAANATLNQCQAEKDDLSNDLNSKAETIAQLERRVAELTTAADVTLETRMRDLRKSLEKEHRQAVEQVRFTWEQRLATAEEAYAAARRREDAASRGPYAGLAPSGALRQSHTTDDISKRSVDKPSEHNLEQATKRIFNNAVEHHAEFHAKLPTKVCQPLPPTDQRCKARLGTERSVDGLPRAPATSNDPHERRATAPQPLLPPTAEVMPDGDRHHLSPTGFARTQGRPPRSAKASTKHLSPDVSSRSESISKSISGSLSAKVLRSLPADVSESVSDSALDTAMRRHDDRCCELYPKLNETSVESGHHHQGHDEDSVPVEYLASLVQPSRNAAGWRGLHRHEPFALGEHRDLCRGEEQPDDKRASPEPARGARETLNAAADIAGKGRRFLADPDMAMVSVAAAEANNSSQNMPYSRKSQLQNQRRDQHQHQESCVSSLSMVAGTAEERGRTRTLTSSGGTPGKSEEVASRSNEKLVPTSRGGLSWSDAELPPAGHNNADAHRLLPDSVAESVERSSSGTNNASRLVPVCYCYPALATAPNGRPSSKSASASGLASSAGYGSGSNSASQSSPNMGSPSVQICTSPSNSRCGGCRTAGGSQASIESRFCPEFASAVESSRKVQRFEGRRRSVSPSCKGSSWSQPHHSSPLVFNGRHAYSSASAWTETTNGNGATISPSRQMSRSDSNRHERSASTPSRSTSSWTKAITLSSSEVKVTRSTDPCVCERARREGEITLPPQATSTTTVPLQSWLSQPSSQSAVHRSGPRPEIRYSSSSGKSSIQNSQPASPRSRNASREMHSAGTHSGVGSGDGNADSRMSWSAASASDTPLSTSTQSNRSAISMPSSSRESRRAPRVETIGVRVRTDLGPSKSITPPPPPPSPRLPSSQSSSRQSAPRQYSSAAQDLTQPTLQPENLPRSTSNRSYDKRQSITSGSRTRSSKLSRSARSSSPRWFSTPTEARLPASDETSTGSVEGGLRSHERISPPPLMNPASASYASRDVEGAWRDERWTGNVRTPAARHDSRSEVSSKSTYLDQGGWDSGEERAVPPLQPVTLTASGSPPRSSLRSNKTRGDRAIAGGPRFTTATEIPAQEDNQVPERRLSDNLTQIDLQQVDVSDHSEDPPQPPPSTIATSDNSGRWAAPSNRCSGCESLSSPPKLSASTKKSEESRSSQDGAPARQTISYTRGSAAPYSTSSSISSLCRSISDSQSRRETRALDRKARRGGSDGTSYSLHRSEARSSGDSGSGSGLSYSASRSAGGPPVGDIQPRRQLGSRSAVGGTEDGTRENLRAGSSNLGSPRSS